MKNVLNSVEFFYRKLTANQRALPNCYILGAQKAGTSSLYYYLTQHPRINDTFAKEVHYFSGGIFEGKDNFCNGINWYKAHFAKMTPNKATSINIDATPMYLFNPDVPVRIKSLTPDAKMIVLLRDPVERAISHYFHTVRHGFEDLGITEAFESENERLSNIIQTGDFNHPDYRVFSYLTRGRYFEQLKRYESVFSKSQLLILSSEAFYKDPATIVSQVFEFLELEPCTTTIDYTAKNLGLNKRRVPNEVYTLLSNYFKEPNRQLFEYLGLEYNWL